MGFVALLALVRRVRASVLSSVSDGWAHLLYGLE